MAESSFSHLSPGLRARAFRNFAGDARREAARSKGGVRESYLRVAEEWERLAVETEAIGVNPTGPRPRLTANR
jgi:hypothetical protein